jgi:hypothetical protein
LKNVQTFPAIAPTFQRERRRNCGKASGENMVELLNRCSAPTERVKLRRPARAYGVSGSCSSAGNVEATLTALQSRPLRGDLQQAAAVGADVDVIEADMMA